MKILAENPSKLADPQLTGQVQMHYHREFRCLQEEAYEFWLENFVAKDIHYWMPVIEVRMRKDKRPEPGLDDVSIFDEGYGDLQQRIDRLATGTVWMEDPASRIRYFLTNLEVYKTDDANEFRTYSNLLVVRNRRQLEMTQHSIGREDLIRREGDGFKVFRRKLLLDARVTQDKNLYFFC